MRTPTLPESLLRNIGVIDAAKNCAISGLIEVYSALFTKNEKLLHFKSVRNLCGWNVGGQQIPPTLWMSAQCHPAAKRSDTLLWRLFLSRVIFNVKDKVIISSAYLTFLWTLK